MATYVKLSSTLDPIQHKRPIEKGWQSLNRSVNDALGWINDGFGVGLKLSDDIAVIDIDGEVPPNELPELLAICKKCVSIVAKTLRGYHVFVNRHSLISSNLPPGKYKWGEVNVEVYDSSSSRQVVLPVVGTPRQRLGGSFLIVNPQIKLELLDKYFDKIGKLDTKPVIDYIKTKVRPQISVSSDSDSYNENEDVQRGRLAELFGMRWWTVSANDAVKVMREAKRGERHNTLLTISVFFCAMGYDSDEQAVSLLKDAAETAWGEEFDEDEFNNIWNTRQKVGLKLKEIVDKLKSEKNKVTVMGGRRKNKTVAELFEEVFNGDEVWWVKKNGTTFILHAGYAISEAFFITYLMQRGFAVGETVANQLFSYVIANTQVDWNATIVGNYVVTVGNTLMVAGRVGNELGLITYNGASFVFLPPGSVEGVYIRFVDRYRDFSNYLNGDIIEYIAEFIEVVSIMTGKNDGLAALLANIVTGTARGGVIITGVAGSGKSTINLFMQLVAQGDGYFVNLTDKRDVVAALINSRIVGLDESDVLDDNLQDVLKSIISYGKVMQRELYTTNDVATFDSEASVVLSSVEVRKLQPDLLRRCVVVNIVKKREAIIPESLLFEAMYREKEKYLLACMAMSTITKKNHEFNFLNLLTNGITSTNELPEYLRDVSKYDIAYTFYNSAKKIGVRDDAIFELWQDLRGNVFALALDGWGEVISKYESDKVFAELIEQGLQASDIVARLDVELPDQKAYAIKLSRTAGRVEPILKEIGYSLEIVNATSNYSRKKVKKFILKKSLKANGVIKENEEAPF